MDGHPLLDEGGGEIAIPVRGDERSAVSADGTVSVDGAPAARVGLVDRSRTRPSSSARRACSSAPTPARCRSRTAGCVQGFLEQSNVNPVAEMARMVEVQRAYEYGQKLMDQEDERIRLVVRTLGQQG